MVSVIPSARSPLDTIMEQVGSGLSQTLPNAINQMGQRQRAMNAIDQAQSEIANAGKDPMKLALAFAKIQAASPESARGMGPVFQMALQQAQTKNAFGGGQGESGTEPMPGQVPNVPQGTIEQPMPGMPQAQPSTFATPSPFNIMTPDEIDAESKRYAMAVNDPNAYSTRQAQLQNKNIQAENLRSGLEDMALKSNIKTEDLPRFMLIGSKYDPRNPSEWMQNTKREWQKVKANDEKLQKAFIPGIGNALLGNNREETLKKLIPTVQDQVKAGLEQETRNFLADKYLTPTEVEEMIHPLSKEKEKAIKGLPHGLFPMEKAIGGISKAGPMPLHGAKEKGPTISYEEAVERAPKELQQIQDKLAQWFLKNLDKETSILAVRDKLIHDKDYDWRQIGPAIRQAESMGLKLEPFQSTEMTDVETQAPYDSLPEIFQSFDRFTRHLRENK